MSQGHDTSTPEGTRDHHQKPWDSARVTASACKLLEDALDGRSCARLMVASSRESGAWLNATPHSS